MLGFVVFGVLLAVAGYFDYRERQIPDVVTAFLWLAFFYFGTAYNIAVLVFGLLFAITSIIHLVWKKLIYGWGDLLIIPMFVAMLYPSPFMLTFLIPAVVPFWGEEKYPVACWLAVFYGLYGLCLLFLHSTALFQGIV